MNKQNVVCPYTGILFIHKQEWEMMMLQHGETFENLMLSERS